jgi:hypothetical protein
MKPPLSLSRSKTAVAIGKSSTANRRPWHAFLQSLCWSSCVVRLHRHPRSCSHLHQALLSSALCTYSNSGSVTLPGRSSGCASLGDGCCSMVLCAENLYERQRQKGQLHLLRDAVFSILVCHHCARKLHRIETSGAMSTVGMA